MRNVWKRSLSLLLAMVMVFGILPVSTRATEDDLEPVESVSVTEPPVQGTIDAKSVVQGTDDTLEIEVQSSAVSGSAPEDDLAADDPQEPEDADPEIVTQTVWAAPDENDLISDAELFAAYVEQKFFGGVMELGTAAGEELTGDIQLAYEALVPIIKQIANGERASTTITLGVAKGTNTPDVEVAFSGSAFTADTIYADLTILMNALLFDLPYELYWFDKTSGVSMKTNGNSSALFVQLDFCVSQNYQGSAEYTVDTAKTGAASKAVENAQAVVEQYEENSDYDKLVAYKEWICGAVSYNSGAAQSENFSENADPWQLIYVFDDDPETNVVCEGYSKAFQYLCDLSVFQEDILCYSVTGTMSSEMGGGGHMWNIVDIADARYLVDVTNSDSGTIGWDGSLFLVGAAPNEDGSYTFGIVTFTYDENTLTMWEDTDVLTLAQSDYAPAIQNVEDENGAQDRLEQALQANIDSPYPYTMKESVTLTRDLTVDLSSTDDPNSNLLSIPSGITLTVPSGVTLTVDTVIMLQGGSLVIEDGGKLVLNARIWVHNGSGSGGVLTVAEGSTVSFGEGGSVLLEQDGSRIDGTIPKDKLVAQSTVASLEELKKALALDLASYAYHNVFVSGSVTVTEALTIPDGAYVNLNELSELTIGTEENPVTLVNNGGLYVLPGSQMVITPGSVVQNNGQLGNFEGTLTGTVTGNAVFGDAEGVNRGSCGENLVWNFEDGTLIITETSEGAGGAMASYAPGEAPWYELRDSITAIDVRAGTSIGDYSTFYGLYYVTSISLPRTLKGVSVENFNSLFKLETIDFPDGNDNGLTVVDGVSVLKTDGDEVILTATARNISNYTIPDSVTRISISGIGVVGLSTLTIPASVTRLDSSALQHCFSIQTITFTGSAPTIGETAFRNIEATVYYPVNDDTWDKVVNDTYGGDITWSPSCCVVISEDNPTQLMGGKSVTLKASLYPSNPTKTSIVWRLKDSDDSAFVSLTAAGKLTVKTIAERRSITVVAAAKDGQAAPAELTITLIPMASAVEIFRGEQPVTGKTIEVDLNSPALTDIVLTAAVLPEDAEQSVTWKISDSKGQYVTCEEDSGALTLTPAGKTGSVTVTATANDGSKKAAKVTIKFVKLAQEVKILNVPEYLLGGKSVTLTTDVASDKTLTSKTVLWSLSDASEPYATITSSGKLTVRQISEQVDIEVTAAVAGNPQATQTVTIRAYPAVEAVQLSREGRIFADGGKLTWDVGDGILQLSAKCYPAEARQEGKWTVSNSSIATISENGVLTLLKAGTVKVTFTAADGSNKKATLNVTVTRNVAYVEIEVPDPAKVRSGQSLTLKATAYAADGTLATNQKFGWDVGLPERLSEDEFVFHKMDVAATVKNGKVTAKTVAQDNMIAVNAWSMENGCSKAILLTVRPKDDRMLNLYDQDEQLIAPNEVVKLNPGDSFPVSACWYLGGDVKPETVENCTFTSSNPKAAAVDSDGTVTAVNYGKTTITAKTTDPNTGKTVSTKFTVEVKNVAKRVTIADPGTEYLRSGQSLNLKATVWSDSNFTNLATNQKVTWNVLELLEEASEDNSYVRSWLNYTDAATISSNGKLSAKNVTENTTISVDACSAESDWIRESCILTIRPKQAYQMSIWVDGAPVTGTLSIPVDREPVITSDRIQTMVYVSVPGDENDGKYVLVEDVVWTSSNPKTAEFDEDGNLEFKGTGSTTITAKCSMTVDGKETVLSAKFSCKAVRSVNSITISQKVPGAYLFSGKTLQLTAAVNSDASNKKVTWTSSDPSVATVNASGLVKAGKVYQQTTVTITATAQDGFGETDSMELTIYPTATTVSIWKDGYVLNNRTVTVSLSECTSMELQALVYPSGDLGALQDVTWSSSNNKVAQCTDGILTLKKAGTVTIKATAKDGSKKTVSFKLVITA